MKNIFTCITRLEVRAHAVSPVAIIILVIIISCFNAKADIVSLNGLNGVGIEFSITQTLEIGSAFPQGEEHDLIIGYDGRQHDISLVGLSYSGSGIDWFIDFDGQRESIDTGDSFQFDNIMIEILNGSVSTVPTLNARMQYRAFQVDAIPEPSTAGLMGVAAFVMFALRRRLKR